MKEHSYKAEDIAEIHTDQCSRNRPIVCILEEVKWNPQTVPECQFILPYTVATAAYDKSISLDSYTPQARARSDVLDLMTRISAKEEPALPVFAARVYTTLKDGREYSKEYINVKGNPSNPFTELELTDKLKMCVPYSA